LEKEGKGGGKSQCFQGVRWGLTSRGVSDTMAGLDTPGRGGMGGGANRKQERKYWRFLSISNISLKETLQVKHYSESTTRHFAGQRYNFKFEFVKFGSVEKAVEVEGKESVLSIINAAMRHRGINLEASRIRRHLEKQAKTEADGLIS